MLFVSLSGVNFECSVSLRMFQGKPPIFQPIKVLSRAAHEEIENNKLCFQYFCFFLEVTKCLYDAQIGLVRGIIQNFNKHLWASPTLGRMHDVCNILKRVVLLVMHSNRIFLSSSILTGSRKLYKFCTMRFCLEHLSGLEFCFVLKNGKNLKFFLLFISLLLPISP